MRTMMGTDFDGFAMEETMFSDENFHCYAYTGELLPMATTELEFRKTFVEQEFSKVFAMADKSGKKFLNKLKQADIRFIKRVLSISGVIRIILMPYEFLIQKGDAFSWLDIESELIEAVKKLYWKKFKIREVAVVGFNRVPEPAFWPSDKE